MGAIQEENLKAIADAIRAKDGTTAPICANQFADRIMAISSVPDDVYNIAIATNDASLGDVSGGGFAGQGMTVTIKAMTGEGNKFIGWQENEQTVSEDENYTFVVSKDRELTGVFEAGRLPNGYTEVEYISSSGGAYIDTLIMPTETTDMIIDAEPNSKVSINGIDYYIAGCTASLTGGYTMDFLIKTNGSCVMGGMGVSPNYQYVSGSNIFLNKRAKFRLDTNTFTYWEDETSKGVPSSYRDEYSTYLKFLTESIKVFDTHSNQYYTLSCQIKFYSIKIYNESNLSFDGIPCINPDGEVGIYDLVGHEFHGNMYESGELTAGPAITA